MTKYNTIQGDTWDIISFKVYNNEKYIHLLLEANQEYKKIVVFPANITINIPEVTITNTDNFPKWRKRID